MPKYYALIVVGLLDQTQVRSDWLLRRLKIAQEKLSVDLQHPSSAFGQGLLSQ